MRDDNDNYNYPYNWEDEDKKDDGENMITIKINYHWEILIEKMLKALVLFVRNKFHK